MFMDLYPRKAIRTSFENLNITYGLLILFLMVLYSCSSSSSNNVLNFLFDGASSPDSLKPFNEPGL